MTTRERVAMIGAAIIIALVLLGPSIAAQLQQSGGPGSTVTIGAALPVGNNNIGDVDVVSVPADPFGANADAASASGSISAKLRFIASTGIAITALPALAASTNTIGVVIPKTPCGTTPANQDLAAVPTSSTVVFSSTTCLMRAYFNNTNASAQTVTVTDNAGSPINGVGPAFSVPGLSNMVIPYDGIRFASGVKWTAGGTGITGGMWGFQ